MTTVPIGLALITDQALSLAQLVGIQDAFSQSELPMKVDVLDWATASLAFRQIVVRDKVVVQGLGRNNAL